MRHAHFFEKHRQFFKTDHRQHNANYHSQQKQNRKKESVAPTDIGKGSNDAECHQIRYDMHLNHKTSFNPLSDSWQIR